MKKIIIMFELLFINVSNILSQEKISLQFLSILSIKNEIRIKFEFENISDKDIALYIPTSQDICRQIFKIKFISVKDSTVHTYEPCTWYTDLSYIRLDCKNSIILMPKEKKIINMNLSKKHFSPFLSKDTSYKVLLEIYLKDINIQSIFSNYFNEDISSNYLIFKNY